jgi:hypothetical protein
MSIPHVPGRHSIGHAASSATGAALDKTATATTVRRRDGRPLVSDGPFAETREQLGGYYVIEVDSRDDAIAWAEKSPALAHGTVDLRPVLEY